jgi:uncharacterized protein YfiM (DUF2279 family)
MKQAIMAINISSFIQRLLASFVLTLSYSCAFASDSWDGHDKVNHFAVSASIGKLAASAYGKTAGAFVAAIPGAIKELSDLGGSGTPSLRDMAANFAGAFFGTMLPERCMVAPLGSNGAVNGAMVAYYIEL